MISVDLVMKTTEEILIIGIINHGTEKNSTSDH